MWSSGSGDARTTAGFLMAAFGFTCTAHAGPETGILAKSSYVLEQGDIRLVISGALSTDSPIAAHVHKHGDGVHDGVLELAQVAAFGDTVHTFVNRSNYSGTRLEPGYSAENLPNSTVGPAVGLTRIDHIVGNVEQGMLNDWVGFYREVFGFAQLQQFDDAQIRTEYSALASTVVWDGSNIVMPINEPADGLKKSQIQEYIEYYDGPGVQHLALRTDDIVASVQALRDRGVRFMRVPDSYYGGATVRLAGFDLAWEDLRRLNILADRDDDGYLLQIFTETITDRPAVFFEIIERHGALGFGEGNFKALFEAIERDQDRRGNL